MTKNKTHTQENTNGIIYRLMHNYDIIYKHMHMHYAAYTTEKQKNKCND